VKSGRPEGLLVPLITPFDGSTGDIAPVHLRENARALLAAGVDGLVPAGSTGEAALLAENEYRELVGWLRDVVPDECWLIAGAGRESTRGTVAACRVAADEGADAVLVRPPAYYGPSLSPAALAEHFRRVADESPLPVLLYNIPKYTHVSISEGVVVALVEHENIWGAKDSSGDLKSFAAYREAAPGWTMLVGSGALYYAALEMGGAGSIAAVANFAAGRTVEIGRRFRAGDKAAAGAAQEVVAPLHRAIVAAMGVPGVKAAVDVVGLHGGPVRSPLQSLDHRAREEVRGLLAGAGLTG
jgi:dihydrodipicolinate synthase/N-acetylneuraminate lyase